MELQQNRNELLEKSYTNKTKGKHLERYLPFKKFIQTLYCIIS